MPKWSEPARSFSYAGFYTEIGDISGRNSHFADEQGAPLLSKVSFIEAALYIILCRTSVVNVVTQYNRRKKKERGGSFFSD